ncbi:unnamed protein product [Adineta ricciae]|uniref:Uncharacterized protein n=1 Tax=Adineta ricciae TaxID=249248 RepID=A0A814AI90_ADIRI|nr:unnamed protein product [Adineta ricciae]
MKDERIIERIGIIEDPNQTVISRLLPEQIMMRRIRTTLLILLGFLLMSDLVGLVLFVHFHVHGSKPSSKLNIKRELLWRVFSVFYYAFGLIATIQYFRKGLCVFASIGSFILIILSATFATIYITAFYRKQRFFSYETDADIFYSVIYTIAAKISFVVLFIIVCLSFKLSNLLTMNRRPIIRTV